MGKALAIEENGTKYTVVIKKVTYAQYNDILDEITDVSVSGQGSTGGKIKLWKMRRLFLKAAIESINPTGLSIDNISIENGQKLETEAMRYNGLEPDEKGLFPDSG